jgi:hypothetical protein
MITLQKLNIAVIKLFMANGALITNFSVLTKHSAATKTGIPPSHWELARPRITWKMGRRRI